MNLRPSLIDHMETEDAGTEEAEDAAAAEVEEEVSER